MGKASVDIVRDFTNICMVEVTEHTYLVVVMGIMSFMDYGNFYMFCYSYRTN